MSSKQSSESYKFCNEVRIESSFHKPRWKIRWQGSSALMKKLWYYRHLTLAAMWAFSLFGECTKRSRQGYMHTPCWWRRATKATMTLEIPLGYCKAEKKSSELVVAICIWKSQKPHPPCVTEGWVHVGRPLWSHGVLRPRQQTIWKYLHMEVPVFVNLFRIFMFSIALQSLFFLGTKKYGVNS